MVRQLLKSWQHCPVEIGGGNLTMRSNENVVSIVRSQPDAEPAKSTSDIPNLSFDDASGLAEIETQANQLLDYIGS